MVRDANVKPITSAGGVTERAIHIAFLSTGIEQPERIRVIFPEVAAICAEIRMFQTGEVIVIEIVLARNKTFGNRTHFRMAWSTSVDVLFRCKGSPAGQQKIGRACGCRIFFVITDMFSARAVTAFATDARFAPTRGIAIRLRIIVFLKLTYVTAEAGGVERQHRIAPVKRRIVYIEKMAHHGVRGVKPFFLRNIVTQGEGLKFAFLKLGKKIKDVLTAERMQDGVGDRLGVILFSQYPACEINGIGQRIADNQRFGQRGQVLLDKGFGYGLHGFAMV